MTSLKALKRKQSNMQSKFYSLETHFNLTNTGTKQGISLRYDPDFDNIFLLAEIN
jgi:hypothetical protein